MIPLAYEPLTDRLWVAVVVVGLCVACLVAGYIIERKERKENHRGK